MAYTYDDFVTAANKAGKMGSFTQEDLNIARVSPEYGLGMLRLQQDYDGATTTEQRLLAQEGQKQLRSTYSFPSTPASSTPSTPANGAGGTPTATGAQPSTTDAAGSTGSFTYSNQGKLDSLTDKVVNREPFQYDPTKDTSLIGARKQYLREAERSREDTLAKTSAYTGGTPSSFAVTAAQQAGDYHMTQFADKAAQLEQTAYQRYLNEAQQNITDLGVLTDQRDFDYKAYLNQVEQDNNKFQGAMTLYETYKNTMSIDQMRQLFASMGYLTPAVETFLSNMANPTYAYVPESGGSGGTKGGLYLTDEQLAAIAMERNYLIGQTLAGNKKTVDAKMKNQKITTNDAMWYRNS